MSPRFVDGRGGVAPHVLAGAGLEHPAGLQNIEVEGHLEGEWIGHPPQPLAFELRAFIVRPRGCFTGFLLSLYGTTLDPADRSPPRPSRRIEAASGRITATPTGSGRFWRL
ncbi:hypothetical protein [Methylobacterium indicum]|uniref:hypothetical protein n=1 Tax=Methylobacterium indicum TaxID=1775910 RepID=UPI000F79B663|nr:hypothetical protein [Methylobacterium indicum]